MKTEKEYRIISTVLGIVYTAIIGIGIGALTGNNWCSEIFLNFAEFCFQWLTIGTVKLRIEIVGSRFSDINDIATTNETVTSKG